MNDEELEKLFAQRGSNNSDEREKAIEKIFSFLLHQVEIAIAKVVRRFGSLKSEEPEDLVQTAFVDARSSILLEKFRYRSKGEFLSWIYTVSYRCYQQAKRKEKRMSESFSRLAQEKYHEVTRDWYEENCKIEMMEFRNSLEQCLKKHIDQDNLYVLKQVFWNNLTWEEVGQKQGAKGGTLRARFHRARQNLEQCLRSKGLDHA